MPQSTCLVAGCNQKAYSRGLCIQHYQAASYQLKRTGKTWADLESAGLALPRGVQRRSDFADEVAAVLADTDQPESE